jgi:PAS domain S-box-containing protein
MEEPLHLLFLEDISADYELEVREIKKSRLKFQSVRVETEEEFCQELINFNPDIIISDYSLPTFNGMKALEISLKHNPLIPFIMCTGSMNEETAVECLKAGATDYVIKERLKRLPFAIREALLRKDILKEKQAALEKLRESEAQLKRAQKIANIGSWEFDFNTGLVSASDEAREIYGIYDDHLTIEKAQSFVLPQYRAMLDLAMQEHINSGKPYNVEFQIIRASDQELRYVHSMAEYDSIRKKLSGIIRDITEKKNNEGLVKEILVARESARFKQDFLARMSHEIRTPLTAITGMIELIRIEGLDEKTQEYFETIRFSSESLKNIVNEVLDFSKIEAGEIKLRPVDFHSGEIFDRSEKLFQSLSKKELRFLSRGRKKLPEYLRADKQRVFQIITNLISNAVKYSGSGEVILEANSENKPSGELLVKISIHDSGPGIPKQLKEKLFKPFSQIHNQDEIQIEGTGLGLSICKELATLLGGEIGVESKNGKGSTFWFTFRAKKVKNGSTQPDLLEDDTVRKSGLNILLAEDKLVNQKVISMLLKSMGHTVQIAQNGKEAISLFKKDTFDLILMDIQMPVMDGIMATKMLKRHCKKLPPIVGLSASAFEGDREQYMAQGMDDYLTKPFKTSDFITLIDQLQL